MHNAYVEFSPANSRDGYHSTENRDVYIHTTHRTAPAEEEACYRAASNVHEGHLGQGRQRGRPDRPMGTQGVADTPQAHWQAAGREIRVQVEARLGVVREGCGVRELSDRGNTRGTRLPMSTCASERQDISTYRSLVPGRAHRGSPAAEILLAAGSPDTTGTQWAAAPHREEEGRT